MSDQKSSVPSPTAAVIGGGPAGLMAAEILSAAGMKVTLYEHMPSVGRKLLMAGRGGLNLTHSEEFEAFLSRYGKMAERLRPILEAFPPKALMAWAEGLGQPLFAGSSGRVFPKAMKASPLLRAWLARLAAQHVDIRTRHHWIGWDESGGLLFRGKAESVKTDIVIFALGGASWPKLGSDGGWTAHFPHEALAPLQPANCGFSVAWSDIFSSRFVGTPLKNIALSFAGQRVRGEIILTNYGVEGGAVYALASALREALAAGGPAHLTIDLRPDLTAQQIAKKLDRPRGGQTVTNFLRKALNLSPAEINLLRETIGVDFFTEARSLADSIKAVPLNIVAPQSLQRAISTAGGVRFSALDDALMLRDRPGIFLAGEMLDWEAPTGGYLLQACFATGAVAAKGALAFLDRKATAHG